MESLLQFHDFILGITCAMEARDPHTSHHSLRVAEMTEVICQHLNLPKEEKELYHISAHLHDIGKIGIPDSVLMKKGKLSQQEWDIMKSHSEKGGQILMNIPSFWEAAQIVRAHHERYDGKGYPDKLAGNQIPLGARIIAIADSIDAMLSNRPYRKGMNSEECLEQIKNNRGIMYDPFITDCVISVWDELLTKRMNIEIN